MKKLIDADKLAENFAVPSYEAFLPAYILSCIKEAPTVDAVEVVRCSDCGSFDEFKNDNRGYCERHREVVYSTHYCGYGKPKENN